MHWNRLFPAAAIAVAVAGAGSGALRAQEVVSSGTFETPAEAMSPGPITPGSRYEFSFSAPVGARLSLATMFVQSNDWFYATPAEGIGLFDDMGHAVNGPITEMIGLWDAGTEADQEPGAGGDQAPRQSMANHGAPDANQTVRAVNPTAEGVPPTDKVLRVTVMASDQMGDQTRFTVTIENVATMTRLQTMDMGERPLLLSPGIWAVHWGPTPLFVPGQSARGHGLEALAEDGNPAPLMSMLSKHEGMEK